jgi:hypothetical protein
VRLPSGDIWGREGEQGASCSCFCSRIVASPRQSLALSTRCKLASDAHRAVVGGPCIKAGRAGRRPEVALLVSLFPPHWLARGGLALALAFVVASPRQAG